MLLNIFRYDACDDDSILGKINGFILQILNERIFLLPPQIQLISSLKTDSYCTHTIVSYST